MGAQHLAEVLAAGRDNALLDPNQGPVAVDVSLATGDERRERQRHVVGTRMRGKVDFHDSAVYLIGYDPTRRRLGINVAQDVEGPAHGSTSSIECPRFYCDR